VTQEFQGHSDTVTSVDINGEYVMTGSDDKTARIWNKDGKSIQTFTGHTDSVLSVALSNLGVALTGSKDGTAILWDVQTGTKLMKYTEHDGPVLTVGFTKDGWYILTGSEDNTAKV